MPEVIIRGRQKGNGQTQSVAVIPIVHDIKGRVCGIECLDALIHRFPSLLPVVIDWPVHGNFLFRNEFLENNIAPFKGQAILSLCVEDTGGQVFHPVLVPGVILSGLLDHAHALIRIKLHYHGNLRIVSQIIYQLGIVELGAVLPVLEIVRQQKLFPILQILAALTGCHVQVIMYLAVKIAVDGLLPDVVYRKAAGGFSFRCRLCFLLTDRSLDRVSFHFRNNFEIQVIQHIQHSRVKGFALFLQDAFHSLHPCRTVKHRNIR